MRNVINMACFELKIDNKTYTLPTNGLNDLSSLVKAAVDFRYNNPEGFARFCESLRRNQSKVLSLEIKPLTIKELRDFLPALKDNLSKAGIILHDSSVEFQEAIDQFGLDPNAKSFVLGGEIYIDPSLFNITDAFHEISHLFFAVLKVKSPKKYTALLDRLIQNPVILLIFKNLPKSEGRSDLGLEADLKEEAVMQFIEMALSNKLSESEMESSLDLIDENLYPVIKEIFGLQAYPGFVTFMNSFITDVTTFGGMAVMRPQLDSVGFIDYKLHAIKSAGVSDYIANLAEAGLLIKGECE